MMRNFIYIAPFITLHAALSALQEKEKRIIVITNTDK